MFARYKVENTPATLAALSFAIDAVRAERDIEEKQHNPAGFAMLQAHRDALGALYQSLATVQTRAARPTRAGKRWTPDEDATLRACWGSARRTAGGSEEALQGLADAVDRSPVAVALRLQSLGIWH